MKDAITWFEIPALDFERAINFYETVLDQKLNRMEDPNVPYAFFSHQGTVGGAITSHSDRQPSKDGVLIYLNGGEDLTPALERARAAGATIELEKQLISKEIGYMAILHDLEGNRVALHSPA